jgi:hypothetical protein
VDAPAVAWQANIHGNAALDTTWNAVARAFTIAGATSQNDFRIDVAPRNASVEDPRIARGPVVGCYAVAWRDDRLGHDHVYTRIGFAP